MSLSIRTGDDMETHTSSFASDFFCFLDFRFSTFTHRASTGSPSEGAISDSETRGSVFCFFEGAEEDEEGRFMAVAFWELESLYQSTRAKLSSLSRWAVDTLTLTLTIRSTTFRRVQSGSNA